LLLLLLCGLPDIRHIAAARRVESDNYRGAWVKPFHRQEVRPAGRNHHPRVPGLRNVLIRGDSGVRHGSGPRGGCRHHGNAVSEWLW
jgi:hypothetical protein